MTTSPPQYDSVADLLNDVFHDDKPFRDTVQEQVERTLIVDQLASLRNRKGLTQKEVADRMGCHQSRVSKLEKKLDDALTVEDLRRYAQALDYRVEVVLKKQTGTLLDEIGYHASGIRHSVDRLIHCARDDRGIAEAIARALLEQLSGIVDSLLKSLARLKISAIEGSGTVEPQVHLETLEFDDEDRTAAPDAARPPGSRTPIST